ncbi:MAG: DUF488 family protein [Candidatus Korobacteraceae bacterium]|jgi:uncharacterized protein YeaO (DUF488 family)
MAILLKRASEAASSRDGARVLVDRRRPRGVSEESLKLQAWLPVLGPSNELRRWFNQRPLQWPSFRRSYLAELATGETEDSLTQLHAIAASQRTVTLLTSAKDQKRSHAAILRDLLDGVKKPPSTSGSARAASSGRIRARRNR